MKNIRGIIASSAVVIYLVSAVTFCVLLPGERNTSATDFGAMCINAVYPSASIEFADSRDNDDIEFLGNGANNGTAGDGEKDNDESDSNKDSTTSDNKEPAVLGDDPLVLIVHTHATESYLPESGSNFHSKGEENTVRDVGNHLASSLEAEGIAVVHDKTLHDNPSYNNSYDRSYDTVEDLLKKYPTVQCVIDLHRDAVTSTEPAATVSVGGKECAKYSFVVGSLASTYNSNMSFISSLNGTAAKSYQGFTGKVLEKGYRYNQDLCTKYLLLEIGFNRNDITEARNTAEIFGKILATTLKNG